TADFRRASRERAFATWREISMTSAIAESRPLRIAAFGSAVD
ncbi:IS6 family transposase, partial [Bradyrhizobium diazoefficiens]|nr:IS6 family transposase [Bradyrhizobium japonicum SEMIA 5079]MCD9299092.1 IS6 family transposase [Bradyrhizobium diazoefficiens]